MSGDSSRSVFKYIWCYSIFGSGLRVLSDTDRRTNQMIEEFNKWAASKGSKQRMKER